MAWTPFTRADHDRSRPRYASDTSEKEWQMIEPLMPPQPARGRKRQTDLRAVVDGIFYLLPSGCQWGLLPKDFQPKSTVHYYFKRFTGDGTWAAIHDALYCKTRDLESRDDSPSYAIIDSQSLKSGAEARGHVGLDAGKKVKGRKRHILVDTLGLILKSEVQRDRQTKSTWLRSLAQALDRRANFRVARHQPTLVKGLRALRAHRPRIHPKGHDQAHGKATGPLRLFLNRL